MFKTIIFIITTFFISTTLSIAAPEDLKGTFTGEETLTVYDCSFASVQKKKITTTFTDVVEGSFKGHGSNNDGKFTLEGKFEGDNKVTSELKGKNKWGQNWTATTVGKLNGDEYTYSVKGKVLAHPYCKFKSDVKVMRK